MHNTPDDGLDFFRGIMSCAVIYFLCVWIVALFYLIF